MNGNWKGKSEKRVVDKNNIKKKRIYKIKKFKNEY